MTITEKSDVAKKLTELHLSFKKQLPDKIAEIERHWLALKAAEGSHADLVTLHRMTHSMAGAGGTFGAVAIGAIAKELEQVFKALLNQPEFSLPFPPELQKTVDDTLVHLKRAENKWEPSTSSYTGSVENRKESNQSRVIHLVEDDELLAQDLITKLEHASYFVQHFNNVNDFEAAIKDEMPAAILMDVVFENGNMAGAEVILRLRENYERCPPVIFISVREDMEARLAAARAGARRYFSKPLNMDKLIPALDGLTERVTVTPFNILIVDDDETLLEYYATVLRDSGMAVKTLSKPLKVLEVLNDFTPDIIISDVHMPECMGTELAQVIRQDDSWAMTPIMFLSTEADLNRQLVALDLGGDDFLVKPIAPGHLISAVTARAKRARWSNRIMNNLDDVVRENKYQLAALDQHDIVSTADIAGNITYVNDYFCEISGYDRDELIGKNHRILKSDYHSQSFYKTMWDRISDGKVWHGTICNTNKAGQNYWVKSTIVPFLDEKGKPYKYVSVRTDITDTRLNEERLEFAVDGAGDGVWDWDMQTNLMQFSKIYMEMLGYLENELPHTADTWINGVHPDDWERVDKTLQAYISGESENYSVELRLRCKDGSYKWILCRGTIVSRDNKGKPLRMIGIHSDISAQKEVEKELTVAREEAENANRAKSQFLSSMSHELRTPMNAIMGFGQLLTMDKESPLSETQTDFATEIVKAGTHLLELINEVLDLARIEAGRIDLSIETVELGYVVAEALQLIAPLADKRGIKICINQEGKDIELGHLDHQLNSVRADRTRLRQILLNILSNAVKYNSENGTITVSCFHADDNQMRINITDTGEGLSVEQQAELFKAFNRLGAERKNIEGTGIGLVITKNIVELMGGHIGVESEEGKGSTFWFELPSDTPLTNVESDIDDRMSSPEMLPFSESIKKHTMLYIEDNPANLRLVAQVMGKMDDIHMWSAHEPVLGLELAEEHKPDLILLDINLPGMSGFEVLKQLRQRASTRNTPVLAISANAMPKDIEDGLAAGFDDYITKPIDIRSLMKSVHDALEAENK